MMRTIESLEQELAIAYKNIQHNQEWRDNLSYELTRTKRALWLARAERAKENVKYLKVMLRKTSPKSELFDPMVKFISCWTYTESKCRAYADKFMEET